VLRDSFAIPIPTYISHISGISSAQVGPVQLPGSFSQLIVGETSSGDVSTTGILKTFGGGGVSGFEGVEVGVTTSQADATGQMVLAGSLMGTGTGALDIGLSTGTGMADGAVFVGGDLGGFDIWLIGVSRLDAGDVIGELTVGGDATEVNFVRVGANASSAATGTGTLNVMGSLTGVGGEVTRIIIGESGAVQGHGTVTVGGGTTGMSGFQTVTVEMGELTVESAGLHGLGLVESSFLVVGDGVGTATVEVTGGVTGFLSVLISEVFQGAQGTDTAMGTVTIHTGGLIGAGESGGFNALRVGRVGGFLSATGILNTFGGGGVSGFGNVEVGVAVAVANATGQMVLAGSLMGTGTGDLDIGSSTGTGMANGVVYVDGDLGGFDDLTIGVSEDSGDAIGELHVTGGLLSMFDTVVVGSSTAGGVAHGELHLEGVHMTVNNLDVGFATGGGTATGQVLLNPSLAEVTSQLDLGPGSTLVMHAGGTVRSDGGGESVHYAAIDTGAVNLDGDLEVVFDFVPAGGATFDLIVSGSAIVNDFDNTHVVGLNAGYLVTSFGVLGGPGGTIYQLGVTGSPFFGSVGWSQTTPGSSWFVGSNWGGGAVPGLGNTGLIDSGASVVAASTDGPGHLVVGDLDVRNGSLLIDGMDAQVSDDIRVGVATGPLDVVGELIVSDSLLRAVGPNSLIGLQLPGATGAGQGTVRLSRSLIQLSGGLTLGAGSTLVFGIEGTTRADGEGGTGQYGAIDAGIALLDGIAQVDFDFLPTAGDTFDLISLSTGNTFGGTTFDQIELLGLPTGYTTDVSIVAGTLANEIFRVSIVEVQLSADFDDDGDVDGFDFLKWQRGESPNPLSTSDLANWQAIFGTVAGPITATSSTVPEPATGIMLLLGMVAMFFRRCAAVSKFNSA